jgi:hypothetical protein
VCRICPSRGKYRIASSTPEDLCPIVLRHQRRALSLWNDVRFLFLLWLSLLLKAPLERVKCRSRMAHSAYSAQLTLQRRRSCSPHFEACAVGSCGWDFPSGYQFRQPKRGKQRRGSLRTIVRLPNRPTLFRMDCLLLQVSETRGGSILRR